MEEAVTVSASTADLGDIAEMKRRQAMTEKEIGYMRGDVEPRTSSVLISSSKYLNNPYYRDTFAQAALRKVGDDLPSTYMIPAMSRALAEVRDDAEYLRLVDEERARKPDFAAWLDRRRLTRYRPEEMRHHAPGTLGAVIREFIEGSGMEMEFRSAGIDPRNDVEYINRRRAALHDIEHMVTGFGPNPLGEAALSVMNVVSISNYFSPRLAQYINEANMFVSVASLYRNALHTPEMTAAMFRAWEMAINAGHSIRQPFMLVDWEARLDQTPDEIAEDLNFRRGPGAEWDYSRALILG